MGASDDEEEYIKYGRPLQEEVETVRGQRSKDVQDKAVTRALPVWQQEVVDEQGRRRLHGAFTGGYSAGYFNTVGSKEGWAPTSFKSSREKRTESRTQQSAEDFMDEDELQELQKRKITTQAAFDTFGHGAQEQARQSVIASAQDRPGLPFGILTDLIAPVPDSTGIRLLQKMGWRQGRGVGKAKANKGGQEGSRWGQMASVGTDNVEVFTLPSKDDTHGLGFDPFKGAENFRSAKQDRDRDPTADRPLKRSRGAAFGTGIMDEDDTLGMTDDYFTELDPKQNLDFELHSEEEDDGFQPWKRARDQYRLPGKAEPLRLQSRVEAERGYDLIPGFVKAQHVEMFQYFQPPKVPVDYQAFHHFPEDIQQGAEPAGAEPPQPSGNILRAIQSIAPFVARMGPAFEALAISKNASQPDFSFLTGGEGRDYYRWSVRALKASQADTTGLAIGQRARPLTAHDRGVLLGEADQQAALLPESSDTSALQRAPRGIAQEDRQALQEAMKATFVRGRKQDLELTEPDLKDFGLRPGKTAEKDALLVAKAPLNQAAEAFLKAGQNRFSASGTILEPEATEGGLSMPKQANQQPAPKKETKRLPIRTVVEWRPAPLLCKRFNVPDPFKGKPAYEPEVHKSKFDSLTLPATAAEAAREATVAADRGAAIPVSHLFGQQRKAAEQEILPLPPPPPRPPQPPESISPSEPRETAGDLADSLLASLLGPPAANVPSAGGTEPLPSLVEKPINLFQAIFEDDSDSEEEDNADQDAELATGKGADLRNGDQPISRNAFQGTSLQMTMFPSAEPRDHPMPASNPSPVRDRHAKEELRQVEQPQRGGLVAQNVTKGMSGQRDESMVRTGGLKEGQQTGPLQSFERYQQLEPRLNGRAAFESNSTFPPDEEDIREESLLGADRRGDRSQPNAEEVEEARRILKKAKKKDKHKDRDKRLRKGEKKKSKEKHKDTKYHKARRKENSSEDSDH